MAVNTNDPTTGRPIFNDNDPPDIKVDPGAAASYAEEVGNRIVKADLAALNLYAYKRAGLTGHALDTKTDYVHDGSGWRLWHRAGVAYTPTLTNFSGSPTVAARYSIAAGIVNVSVNITMVGANVGTAPEVSLPIASRAIVGTPLWGRAMYKQGSSYILGEINPSTTTKVQMLVPILATSVMNAATNVNANTPFTWAAGGTMTLEFSYEAA